MRVQPAPPGTRPAARGLLRAARALGLLVLAAGAAAAFTPLRNAVMRYLATPDPEEPAEAIVALAATVHADGTLSAQSLRRMVRALELYAEGRAPLLVVSGAWPEAGVDEAAIRSALARRFGVPAAAMIALGGAQTTWDEARGTTALLGARGLRRVLLVTDGYHAWRARAAFRRAGLEARVAVVGRPAEAARSPGERLALAWQCLRESAAVAYYRLTGRA